MKVKRNSSVHTNKHGFNLIRRSSEHVQASKAHACKAVASAASDAQAQPNYEIGHRPCFTFPFFQQCYTMHSQLAKFSTITRRSLLFTLAKKERKKVQILHMKQSRNDDAAQVAAVSMHACLSGLLIDPAAFDLAKLLSKAVFSCKKMRKVFAKNTVALFICMW